ncbi:MAG: hypothetical protein ACTS41_00015 [Candidatus Hodgkinia cicadicola]
MNLSSHCANLNNWRAGEWAARTPTIRMPMNLPRVMVSTFLKWQHHKRTTKLSYTLTSEDFANALNTQLHFGNIVIM